ncbi:MAG: hypothetical protein MN733_21955, partial [Nitrososphaera sp.]|nr:hypothetical protein [Nitrososphaera sp.]
MALAQIYTAVAGDTITSARWNNEFGNIYNNGTDVAFPVTENVSFDGFVVTFDAVDVTSVQSTAAAAWLYSPGAKTGTPGVNGSHYNQAAATYTDNNTSSSGTAAQWTSFGIRRPTLAASNTFVTTTDAATVYVENAPAAGTNETLTNAYAIWVDDGIVRFDGAVQINGVRYTFPSASGAVGQVLATTEVGTGTATFGFSTPSGP